MTKDGKGKGSGKGGKGGKGDKGGTKSEKKPRVKDDDPEDFETVDASGKIVERKAPLIQFWWTT